ncbi:acetolactate synthase 2 small subunit [Enterobacteriaceae endosymbiont of Donacia versicolorea]|uniref:acetolactate synthase 2 small subunit n=1 Tax=unclassified Enterobacteriaceae TaxID=36866 RepID=UPI0014493B83|nr:MULTISPECIES: acetolactate synthase 2 small subunit [unclassified Enterobacteriaceae]QJC32055.1 acetolactate synthase 2 small subunit [Enterobacteriaceae endosymbiont of Donacia versicolorea]QJC32457.1 acetolactate synthase 2 small subunit [Enterobacteriaceae endosymbiont of Donacia dentata]
MNKYKLYIKTNISPEISERIMRIIRHRGFLIKTVNINVLNKLQNIIFKLIIKSFKSIEILVKQIAKLIDVLDITIIS